MEHCADVMTDILIRSAASSAQTTVTTTSVDTRGYQGISAVVHIGTIAAGGSVKAVLEWSEDNATFTEIAEGVEWAATDDDKLGRLDALPAPARYVRVKVTRDDANSAIVAITGKLYRPGAQPPPAHANTVGTTRIVGRDAV